MKWEYGSFMSDFKTGEALFTNRRAARAFQRSMLPKIAAREGCTIRELNEGDIGGYIWIEPIPVYSTAKEFIES